MEQNNAFKKICTTENSVVSPKSYNIKYNEILIQTICNNVIPREDLNTNKLKQIQLHKKKIKNNKNNNNNQKSLLRLSTVVTSLTDRLENSFDKEKDDNRYYEEEHDSSMILPALIDEYSNSSSDDDYSDGSNFLWNTSFLNEYEGVIGTPTFERK